LIADQPERGLELLHKLKGQTDRCSVAPHEQIDELIASLEKYFADALTLFERAQCAARRPGDHKSAHATLKELKTKFPLSPEAVLCACRCASSPSPRRELLHHDAQLVGAFHTSRPSPRRRSRPAWCELPAWGRSSSRFGRRVCAPELRRINPIESTEVTVRFSARPRT
jgi:hypothetical protein